MQFTNLLAAFLLAGCTAAIPSPSNNGGVCKPPYCTANCPDGTPYDCCAVYVRDPCFDHQVTEKRSSPDEICTCPDGVTTYLCHAEYFRDPCSDPTPDS